MSEHISSATVRPKALKFTHQPLNRPSKDLRLLKVLPKLREGRIQIQMWNFAIDSSAMDYQSSHRWLSYTWNPSEDLYEIRLNGKSLQVRRNLHEFLRRAAKLLSSRVLWIAALCIDQQNVYEKNIQVVRMGKIYRNAHEVFVWLGMDPALLPLARFMSTGPDKPHADSQDAIKASYAAF